MLGKTLSLINLILDSSKNENTKIESISRCIREYRLEKLRASKADADALLNDVKNALDS